MRRALCVIAESTTVAMRLAPGRRDRRLFLSYAEQVPWAAEFDSLTFWMTDAYAADGHPHAVELYRDDLKVHQLSALVQTRDGEAYLSISAPGFPDPRLLAIVLKAVPGVATEDWMPEPGSVLSITAQPGQITYSTIIAPSAQAELLSAYERRYSSAAE